MLRKKSSYTEKTMKFLAKKSLVASAALMGAGAAASAAPLLSIGDSVDVFFNGSTNVQWRSNLFYTDGIDNLPAAALATPPIRPAISRPKEDAFVFFVSPGVEINIGRNSNFGLDIYFREDFLFYTKFSDELNTELANLYVDGTYDWGNLTTNAGFSFVQQQQNSPQTNGLNFVANLVKADNYNAYADASYDISPKAWTTAGFSWTRKDFTNNGDFFNSFSDYDRYDFDTTFFWRVTPKLSVGPSFRLRYTDPETRGGATVVGGGVTPVVRPADYFDYFFNVAVKGEVLPKLTLGLNAGYQLRDPSRSTVTTPFGGIPVVQNQGDRGQFAVRGEAQYEVTPKLMTFANIYNDFGVGSQGQTTTNLGGDVGAIYEINSFLSANAEFGMESTDYQNTAGREDLTTTTGVSLNYIPDVYWQFSLGYYYINNASSQDALPQNGFSNNSGASFQAHTINLQATLRY